MHGLPSSISTSERQTTEEQLMQLGRRKEVYLRAARRDGELVFMLYGADGTNLVTFDTIEEAVSVIANLTKPHGVTRMYVDYRAARPASGDQRLIEQAIDRSVALAARQSPLRTDTGREDEGVTG